MLLSVSIDCSCVDIIVCVKSRLLYISIISSFPSQYELLLDVSNILGILVCSFVGCNTIWKMDIVLFIFAKHEMLEVKDIVHMLSLNINSRLVHVGLDYVAVLLRLETVVSFIEGHHLRSHHGCYTWVYSLFAKILSDPSAIMQS